MNKIKCYYALFKTTADAIEVEFPDLPSCVTFGADWDEAFKNATDALAGWLANAEPQFIRRPSTHKELIEIKTVKLEGAPLETLVPIPVDDEILASYQELKRFNVIFPSSILRRIDLYRKKLRLKRSTFLQIACEEYLEHHQNM